MLNYARKHCYSERRSALTYSEDDYPFCIDLGKDKYGGPFTFEEVEAVKIVLRLIPVIVSGGAFGLALWQEQLFDRVVAHDPIVEFSQTNSKFPENYVVRSLLMDCLILPFL